MTKIKTKYIIIFFEIFSLVFLTLFISYFDLDITTQRLFYHASSSSIWFQKENPFWQFGYHYGTLPAILLTFAALIGFILSWIKPKIKAYRRYFMFIILTLIIGPGLLINAVLKDHWGRPRPRQVQEFGGRWEFKEIWQPGTPGKGKSFPCGHCSMGFFFITIYYCFKRKHKALAYSSVVFSIAIGTFIGFARISQGGHFFSDVLWSWGLTYLTASFLYYFILKIPDYDLKPDADAKEPVMPSARSTGKRRALVIIAIILSIGIMIFTFLFSKPFYQESIHDITGDESVQLIKLRLNINRGDVMIHKGNFKLPVQIKTMARGFGFPEYKYQSMLSRQLKNDTLVANYFLSIKGLFNEIDVQTSVYIDSLSNIYLENDIQKVTKISDNHN
jgi:lipid A 4'-phosphatase